MISNSVTVVGYQNYLDDYDTAKKSLWHSADVPAKMKKVLKHALEITHEKYLFNGCLPVSACIALALRYNNIDAHVILGEASVESEDPFYHAWVDTDGKITDIVIFELSHALVDEMSPVQPVFYTDPTETQHVQYFPDQFEDDFYESELSIVKGKSIAKYADMYPSKNKIWDITLDLLQLPHTTYNRYKLRKIAESEIIGH